MNLAFAYQKQDPVLQIGSAVAPVRQSIGARTFDGFILPAGPTGDIRLQSALRWHPFSARPRSTDWLATTGEAGGVARIEIALIDAKGSTIAREVDEVGPGLTTLSLPALLGPSTREDDEALDLVVRNRSADMTSVTLLVSEIDSPKKFMALATGTGVEVLSGGPAVLKANADHDVFYVGSPERIATSGLVPERRPDLPSAAWSEALIGRSHEIPIVDHALDFIFAPQILHKVVNPLGHLAAWRTKLRAGGRVLAVVPYVAGGADYINHPTVMADWIRQYEGGGFVETQAHHNAFAHARGLNPKSLFRRGHPSHFSFFTTSNLTDVLNFAIDHLGYAGFHIEHARSGRNIRFGLYA